MAKRGRPTKFRPELPEKIRTLYAQGKTDSQVAEIVGVSTRTIDSWKNRFSDFLQALKEGKDLADDMVEASLFQRAIGYTVPEEKVGLSWGKWERTTTLRHYAPDVIAQIFWLKNRRPEKWRERVTIDDLHKNLLPGAVSSESKKVDFTTFCTTAGYPVPFPKQLEMRDFAQETVPRLLLGSRGYGKTDVVTILDSAYQTYLDPTYTILIITKSKARNSAIMGEIAKILTANGILLERENSECVRVKGLAGKDHSIEAVTIRTSIRGRHPHRVTMDDPVTDEDVSEATRKQVKRKYNEIMKLTSNVIVIGQPAHKHDLYAELRPMVKTMEVPYGMIPELDHDLEAQRLAGVDEATIQASYFLNVVSEGGSPFEKIRYLDEFVVGDSVAWFDPSHKGKDTSALTIMRAYGQGIQVVGFVWKKAWHHVLEDSPGTIGVKSRCRQFGVRRLAVETNGLGSQPVEIIGTHLNPLGIGVVGKDSSLNKHAKIMAAAPAAEIIHLSKQSDRAYKDQVVQYEYGAAQDDAPDSLASCLEWLGLIRGKI